MEDIIMLAMLVGQFPNSHLQPNYNSHDFQIIDWGFIFSKGDGNIK